MTTIRELAIEAGLSPGAVSRILNHDVTFSASEQTRKKVFDAAERLHYIKKTSPKTSSGILTFGILQWYSIRQELEDPYYLSIRLGAEKYCSANNINVVRSFKGDSDFFSNLQNVDGLICIGKFCDSEIEQFNKISKNYILVDMYTTRILHNSITLDFENATLDALTYLTSLGHKCIGYLGGREYTDDKHLYFEPRKAVFEEFCNKNLIDYKPYLLEDTYTIKSGYDMMSALIAKGKLPTAVFTASDSIALGAIRALSEHGYCIPSDISIIGFDNINAAAYSTPPLTTISAPSELMGEYASNFLATTHDFYLKYSVPIQIKLPCFLKKRSSCAAPFSSH